MAAAATLNTVTQEIKAGNSQNASWHDEERSRQALRDTMLANSSALTGGWLGKIFGGQDKARKEAAEAARKRLGSKNYMSKENIAKRNKRLKINK